MQQPQRISRGTTTAVIFALMMMASGVSLLFYTTVTRPVQIRFQATATVRSMLNAHAQATSLAHTQATATVEASTTAQAKAQATMAAQQQLYLQATSGTPALNSSLAFADTNRWDVYRTVDGGGCAFLNGAFHASVLQKNYYVPCFAQASNVKNFAFQIEMTLLQGDEGGLIFRADDANSRFYYLRIGHDTTYSLYASKEDKHSTSLLYDTSPAIKTALGQTNLVTVIAKESNIAIYINKTFVASMNDGTYNSGKIGVFASDKGTATDVAFSNAQVWVL